MSTGWNCGFLYLRAMKIINLLGNEYWLERAACGAASITHYKPTGK